MEKVKNVKFVLMTLGELMNVVKFASCNRNHYFDVDEALDNGYYGTNAKSAKSRIKKTIKDIFHNGDVCWSLFCPLVLGGDYTIVEGQGRYKAIVKMYEDGKVGADYNIPCLIYVGSTGDEVIEAIRVMNTNKKNWTVEDKVHYYADLGNDEAKKISKLVLEWKERLHFGTTNSSAVFVIKSSSVNHADRFEKVLSSGKCTLNPDHLIMLETFERIQRLAKDCSEYYYHDFKATETAYALQSIFGGLILYARKDGEKSVSVAKIMESFVEAFGNFFNGKIDKYQYDNGFRRSKMTGRKEWLLSKLYSKTKRKHLRAAFDDIRNPNYKKAA